jgi:dTDP-4-amino-4,6-dideoxygalactose transaminase
MHKVDFFSFKEAPDSLQQEWEVAIREVLDSGKFIGGPYVNKFECEWASYLGVNHAIGVGNGFDAIVVALRVLGIGKNDLVAVPSHTFLATWLAVDSVGAIPVGIDCNPSGLMDLDLLEANNSKFAAVIPVHMHGQMVQMPRLMKWAGDKKIKVVEDCAQAHGAKIENKYAGTWGDIGAFSFYPTKNLGALGDAGAVVTNDDLLATNVRSFVNYGSFPGNKYQYQFKGINSRLDPIQASVLSVNLKYLDLWNSKRQEIASYYVNCFKPFNVSLLPIEGESVFHHFVLQSENRSETQRVLETHGVKTEIHYPESAENSFIKISSDYISNKSIKASTLAAKTLSLPISPWMSDEDIHKVVKAVQSKDVLNTLKKS